MQTSVGPNESQLLEVAAERFVELFDEIVRNVLVPSAGGEERPVTIGPQDARAIIWLGRKGPALMSEFASGIGVPLSTATHMVDRLLLRGMIVRERSEEDRRIVKVGLSEAGGAMEKGFYQRRLHASRNLIGNLSPAERKALLNLLAKALDVQR